MNLIFIFFICIIAAWSIVTMSEGLPFEAVWHWPEAHLVATLAIIGAMLI